MGLSRGRADWDFRFVPIPPYPHSRRHRLDLCYYSEEKRNLASQSTLEPKVWQGLVS